MARKVGGRGGTAAKKENTKNPTGKIRECFVCGDNTADAEPVMKATETGKKRMAWRCMKCK